jgi:muramoyltetrapeptide carboxypeptidase LdcA involved in peptidoglycan recycling
MRGCDEPGDAGPTARDAIQACLEDIDVPILMGFPSGHTTGPCWTLPLGARVRMMSAPRPAIVIEESPVE